MNYLHLFLNQFQIDDLKNELFEAQKRENLLEQNSLAMASMLKQTQNHLTEMKHKMNVLMVCEK